MSNVFLRALETDRKASPFLMKIFWYLIHVELRMKGTDYKRLERLLFQLFSDHFAVCFFFLLFGIAG
jgi:hypothetical protein